MMSQHTHFSILFHANKADMNSTALDCFASARNDKGLVSIEGCFARARNRLELITKYRKMLLLQGFSNNIQTSYEINTSLRARAKQSQNGFTLLEMVLVLFLISLMASATLFLTDNLDDQASYDETKRRMEIIRQAIVGDPTRRLNGQTEISGFVADMGRLPGCLRELVEQNHCIDASSALTAWSIDASTGLGSGWRGPYITVSPESDGSLRFRDGYANTATDASGAAGSNTEASNVSDEERNHGWNWALYDESNSATTDTSTAETIRIQSFGLDGSEKYPTGTITNSQPIVVANDWKIQVPDPITIKVFNSSSTALPSSSEQVVLRIYNDGLNAFISGDDGINDYLDLASGALTANTNNQIQFELFDNDLPIGTYGFSIVCYEQPSGSPENYVIFDGDCESTNAPQSINTIRTFNVAPRQNITLEWSVP